MSYYITKKYFTVDPRYINNPPIRLGDGVDMTDPLDPAKSTYSPFSPEEEEVSEQKTAQAASINSKSIIDDVSLVAECRTTREESDTISQYFKASYGLSNASQSYDRARDEREEYHTIYALLNHSGEAVNLKPPDWGDHNPEMHTVGDPKRDLELFLGRYGSHYVNSIKYGLLLGIQARLHKTESMTKTDFSVAFHGAFGDFGADAGVRKSNTTKLAQSDVTIRLEVTSGGRQDGRQTMFTDFDKVNDFLEELNKGTINFYNAPLEVTLMRYWETLHHDWKNLQQVLTPKEDAYMVPDAQYGVPKGTILPWYPSGEFIKGLGEKAGTPTIVAPDGWAVCDGTGGTPDLRSRFVRGTDNFDDVGRRDGAEEHNHGKTGGPSDTLRIPGGGSKHHLPVEKHTHNVGNSKHLPPYVCLVYIIKL